MCTLGFPVHLHMSLEQCILKLVVTYCPQFRAPIEAQNVDSALRYPFYEKWAPQLLLDRYADIGRHTLHERSNDHLLMLFQAPATISREEVKQIPTSQQHLSNWHGFRLFNNRSQMYA